MATDAQTDLATLGQALAADLRNREAPDSPLGDMLDGLAATFEAALTGHSPLTLRYARNRSGGFDG